MKKTGRVLVALPLDAQQRRRLENAAPYREFLYTDPESPSDADASGTEIILGNVPDEFLSKCRDLRWYQLRTAGADMVLSSDALRGDVLLTNASGAYDQMQAEFMLTVTLALLKRLPAYYRNQQEKRWEDEGLERAVCQSTVLLVGMGQIGSALSRMLKMLGAHTIGITRSGRRVPTADEVYDVSALDAQLPRADIVLLTLPITAETRRLFDRTRFDRFRDGAVFVNAGRGATVDTDALTDALASGKLSAAALDVTDPEPLPPEHPLWTMENVILTPHIAGHDFHPVVLNKTLEICIGNLQRYEQGQPLENVIDREIGYRKK